MNPYDSCVPSTVTLRCQNNYVPIIRSALYGISKVAGSCVYSPGDCVSDTSNTLICLSDSATCSVFGTRRKLAECNDQYNNYVHIEYDCVPISMTDSTKEYNVCQNTTSIASENGIIKSPGYPTQFQTTTAECFRFISVPNNKMIRLWLTDLQIGSTISNCAKDHVYVVDSIQTYRHCGTKRFAYPYLCSSTILIQYLITTQLSFYRGMRMYFEIVDRSPDDVCANLTATITPVPDSTTPILTTSNPGVSTTVPTYVALGIASPISSFQLCRGQSFTIRCPNNYGVVIVQNVFGVTQSNQCEPHDADKHCVITTRPTLSCRQTCSYFYAGNQMLPTCNNQTAAYQYVEYQCIPTNANIVSPATQCPADGSKVSVQIDRNGRFQSFNYPSLTKSNCTYRLRTKPGNIFDIYSLDISLNGYLPGCSSNTLTLIEDGDTEGLEFCEQRDYRLIYSSCSNELDLRYVITDDRALFSSGVSLYIETQSRPSDWACGNTLPTKSSTTARQPTITTPTPVPLTNETYMIARDEIEHDICFQAVLNYPCPTGYTFMIINAFYGVKKQSSNKCGFVQGDCVQDALASLTSCRNDASTCYISYATKRRLAQCQDSYADYLHLTSQCVPSRPVSPGSSIDVFDICESTNNIADFNGIMTSPGFPLYKPTTNECARMLLSIQDRILRIWINEMSISSGVRSSTEEDSNKPDLVFYKSLYKDYSNALEHMTQSIRDVCPRDYLLVNTPHVAYVYCGARKLALPPICAPTITIQYKTTSPPALLYKGFKLYFEWIPKPVEIQCDNGPIATTTPIDGILPPWAQNLELSPILSSHVCLGTSITLQCPRVSDYALAITDSNYAVTGTGSCDLPSASHCRQETSLDLMCTPSCFIEYVIPRPLIQCGSQNADYLNIDYQCIPTRLPNNENPFDICAQSTTDTLAISKGHMISPQYPTLNVARTCSKRIETLSTKLWKIYIADLFLEGSTDTDSCRTSSLTISDGKDILVFCGSQKPQLALISCTNIVEFKFVSSHQALGYRGFKLYFEAIDTPDNWNCVPTTAAPIRTTTRPQTTTSLIPPSLQVIAYGGTTNGTRQFCRFPFKYQNNQQVDCLRTDPPDFPSAQTLREPWCSLTSDFDADRQWGYCRIGVTDSTIYDICRSQQQVLRCPPGYVINIITADYAAKPDGNIGPGACTYSQNDCFQNDQTTIQSTCAGKPSCTAFHFIKTLATCQNRPSAYFHVDYECVPNTVQEVPTYTMCGSDQGIKNDTNRGYIISPNFPNTQNNFDCTFTIQTSKPDQDIYLYILEMDLNIPNAIGQTCSKDRFIITSDSNIQEMCGKSATNFLVNSCQGTITLQLIRANDSRGRGVKLYFEFRTRPPLTPCQVYTTVTRPTVTTISTAPTVPTSPTLPACYPDPCPRTIKNLCYPDVSSLLGINNIQCPKDYVIVIHRAFHGKGGRCDYTPGDCTSEADIVYRLCSGKQGCSVPFIAAVNLPECNRATANYLFVEYQCLPTPTITPIMTELCNGQIDHFGGPSGLLQSPSYPTYTQAQCANTTVNPLSGSNLIIYMYSLSINIGAPDPSTGECTNDYLLLSYQCNNQLYSMRLCGTRSTELLFTTCTPTDKIFASYSLLSSDSQSLNGFALLYHLQPTSAALSTTTSRPTTTTTSQPPGPGPTSTYIQISTSCAQQSLRIQCDMPGYVLILHKVQLAVSKSGTCTYSPDDCFEDRTNMYNTCAGKTTCFMSPPLIAVRNCNNSRSNYMYAEYQCIPTRPKLILDVCSSQNPFERVEGGAIISSLNYTATYQQCKVQLQSNPLLGSQTHKAFKIYILSLNLPIRPSVVREQGIQCSLNDPYIDINDPESGVTRLCGNSHTRYLLETCSNTIDILYNNFNIGTNIGRPKGFEIYFESIQNDLCRPTAAPPTARPPFTINSETVCKSTPGKETVSFQCEPDYGLLFLQSFQFVTRQPYQCDVTQFSCANPSEQPQAQCSGQQACSYTHPNSLSSASNLCQNIPTDATKFYYQCLPMRPSEKFTKYTFCINPETSSDMGFIETSGFPYSYQFGRQQCSIRIPLPKNTDRNYSVYIYSIEIALRDTSIINPSMPIECLDSIQYVDDDKTYSFCGLIDQPALIINTNRKELNLTLNIFESLPSNEMNIWQGARLFYIIGDQSLPTPPIDTSVTAFTTSTVSTTSTTKGEDNTREPIKKKPSHGGVIAGVIIAVLVVLAAIGGFVYYRRNFLQYGRTPTVTYDSGMDAVSSSVVNGTASQQQRSSLLQKSLTGKQGITIISPFYKAKDAPAEQQQNATDA